MSASDLLEAFKMLSMRRRGKKQIFYIRGAVSLGDRAIDVEEFNSGTADEDAASHLMAQMEIELREQLMFGKRAVASRAIVADAFDSYLNKAPKPHSTDIRRVEVMRRGSDAAASRMLKQHGMNFETNIC